MHPVFPKPVDDHGQKYEQRERNRNDDVTCDRERVRNNPDHIQYQDEHENREHEREEFHALRAGGAAQRFCHEFVGRFRDGLQPSRD